ncbi:MAG: SpoIIE family protein phosphatase [Bacteroidales bacterium]|nr:SpoIIE family protein phosphatase [Bacteroidales bacterium]
MTGSFKGIQNKILRLSRRLIYSILILLIIPSGYPQTYYFDNYSTQNGLGQSTVYSIVQDNKGYIWVGTLDGISKFDGNRFENFTTNDGLAPGGVKIIIIDKSGIFWLGHHNGGLTKYDGKQFQQVNTENWENDEDVTTIIEDVDGKIWLGTYGNGAYIIQNPWDKISNLEIQNYKGGKLSDIVFDGVLTRDGALYLITDIGIKKYRRDIHTFINFQPEGHPTYFFKTSMFEDSRNNLWYGTRNGGLIKQNTSDKTFTIFDTRNGLETNFIWSIFEDSRENIWTSNIDDRNINGGVTRISPQGEFLAFNKYNGLIDNKIQCIYEDMEGNILLGTRSNGLSIFKGEKFITYQKGIDNGILDNNALSVYQDHTNNIWVGSDEGISIIQDAGTEKQKIRYLSDRNSIIKNPVKFISADENEDIWIGTDGGGIYTYLKGKNRIYFDPDLNNYVFPGGEDRIIKAFLIDKNNILWIGTTEGLIRYNLNTRERIRIRQQAGLSGNNISSLYSENGNKLLIGAVNAGVSVFDADSQKFWKINSIPSVTPTSFIKDKENNLWIGSESSGLFVYNGDTVSQNITAQNGILSNLVKLLAVDNEYNIYIGTNKGLNKYDYTTKKFLAYTLKDGFIGIETNYHASVLDSEGKIWFGTVKGLTRYNPETDIAELVEPPILITSMMVGSDIVEMKAGLKLRYFENSIRFDYKCISISNPDAILYRYMLEGNDSDWQMPTTEASAKYDRLPPGKYTFKVKAKNNLEIWNNEPKTYTFQIDKPFYQKWYFVISIFTLTLTIIFLVIKRREQQLLKEKRNLEEKVTERTAALSKANLELEKRNKDVTDSIRYAKRIQFAILPPDIPFNNSIVFFKPKDIVSGDFYWSVVHNQKEFIAAVDCTGHGVPGAFMSFIGYNSLNKIVKELNITQPAAILNQLNDEVATTLHQKGKDIVNDGMDIAMVSFDRKTRELEYSGAFNPLYLIRNDELIETKANRFSIGRSTERNNEFTNHSIKIKSGDVIYIFSDGYADQFGGPDNKKFKTYNLKELFLKIHKKPMNEQLEILESTFFQWMGENDQIDDILIIGRKF